MAVNHRVKVLQGGLPSYLFLRTKGWIVKHFGKVYPLDKLDAIHLAIVRHHIDNLEVGHGLPTFLPDLRVEMLIGGLFHDSDQFVHTLLGTSLSEIDVF